MPDTADCAAAAVTVLVEDGHAGRTYELAGDRSFSMSDLAETVSTWAGRRIRYKNLSINDYRSVLVRSGLSSKWGEFFVQTDMAIARGDLDRSDSSLRTLIGRNALTLAQVLASVPVPAFEPSAALSLDKDHPCMHP